MEDNKMKVVILTDKKFLVFEDVISMGRIKDDIVIYHKIRRGEDEIRKSSEMFPIQEIIHVISYLDEVGETYYKRNENPKQIKGIVNLIGLGNDSGLTIQKHVSPISTETIDLVDEHGKAYINLSCFDDNLIDKLNLFGFNISLLFDLEDYLMRNIKRSKYSDTECYSLVSYNDSEHKFIRSDAYNPLFGALYFQIEDVDKVNKVIFEKHNTKLADIRKIFADWGWI